MKRWGSDSVGGDGIPRRRTKFTLFERILDCWTIVYGKCFLLLLFYKQKKIPTVKCMQYTVYIVHTGLSKSTDVKYFWHYNDR